MSYIPEEEVDEVRPSNFNAATVFLDTDTYNTDVSCFEKSSGSNESSPNECFTCGSETWHDEHALLTQLRDVEAKIMHRLDDIDSKISLIGAGKWQRDEKGIDEGLRCAVRCADKEISDVPTMELEIPFDNGVLQGRTTVKYYKAGVATNRKLNWMAYRFPANLGMFLITRVGFIFFITYRTVVYGHTHCCLNSKLLCSCYFCLWLTKLGFCKIYYLPKWWTLFMWVEILAGYSLRMRTNKVYIVWSIEFNNLDRWFIVV